MNLNTRGIFLRKNFAQLCGGRTPKNCGFSRIECRIAEKEASVACYRVGRKLWNIPPAPPRNHMNPNVNCAEAGNFGTFLNHLKSGIFENDGSWYGSGGAGDVPKFPSDPIVASTFKLHSNGPLTSPSLKEEVGGWRCENLCRRCGTFEVWQPQLNRTDTWRSKRVSTKYHI